MKSIITNEQEAIITKLAGDIHSKECSALVNFGAQMYRDGIIKGTIVTMIGVGVGMTVSYIIKRNSEKRLTNGI